MKTDLEFGKALRGLDKKTLHGVVRRGQLIKGSVETLKKDREMKEGRERKDWLV